MLTSNIENDGKNNWIASEHKKSTTAKLWKRHCQMQTIPWFRDLNAENQAKQQKAIREIQPLTNTIN